MRQPDRILMSVRHEGVIWDASPQANSQPTSHNAMGDYEQLYHSTIKVNKAPRAPSTFNQSTIFRSATRSNQE